MNRFRATAGLIVLVSTVFTCARAEAFFHLWSFTEFFSNADGSVQFIELHTSSNNEHFASGAQIRSLSTGNVFTFPSNLSSSATANKRLLIATPGFGGLSGAVSPDFTLPSTSFFDPAGDTISLSAGVAIDSRTFTSVPTDGVMSRVYPSNALDTNSPTNFSGASGSINLSAPPLAGDYNNSGLVEQGDLDLVLGFWGAEAGDVPATWDNDPPIGFVDQAELDRVLSNWGSAALAAGGAGAVPEPAGLTLAALALATGGVWTFCLRKPRRTAE